MLDNPRSPPYTAPRRRPIRLSPGKTGRPLLTRPVMPSRPLLTAAALFALTLTVEAGEPLPDTKPLTDEGDLAAKMVEGIDKYLLRELAASVEKRKAYWKPD